MLTKRGLIGGGLLTFFCGFVALFPARVGVQWFAPENVSISGLSGTVWNGTARQVSIDGIYLHDMSWELRPLSLLTANVSYDLSATPANGFLSAIASFGFSGSVTLSELSAALPLNYFADALGVPGLQGNASLSFERVQFSDGIPSAADGTLQVADLVVPVVGRESLGGYKADFFTQNNGISASIEDTDAIIDLAGSLELNADRSYVFIAQIVSRSTTPQSVRRQLQYLPPANERGQQEIRLEGIL